MSQSKGPRKWERDLPEVSAMRCMRMAGGKAPISGFLAAKNAVGAPFAGPVLVPGRRSRAVAGAAVVCLWHHPGRTRALIANASRLGSKGPGQCSGHIGPQELHGHFGIGAPPILDPILVVGLNQMFTGGTIWVLTHGMAQAPCWDVDFRRSPDATSPSWRSPARSNSAWAPGPHRPKMGASRLPPMTRCNELTMDVYGD